MNDTKVVTHSFYAGLGLAVTGHNVFAYLFASIAVSLCLHTQSHILCEECNGHSDMSTHECRTTRNNYLNTEEFIDAVAEELRAKL
jgi:hypothetical protein